MATLFNTKISTSYVGLLKTIDNAVIDATLRELTDGSGNQSGLYLNTSGDFKATGVLEFGSLKDTGENITITKFVDEADGIANNDNDTTIPTSAAIVDYVAARITLEDLDFSGDSGTGSVDLDSQVFAIVGTANEIETTAGSQQLQIGLPSTITVNLTGNVTGNVTGNLTGDVTGDVTGNLTGDTTGNVTATSVLANGVTATTQSAGDNSTKVATTAYVETAVDTVDTLAEILAIGNTTGATKISVDNTSSGIDLIDDAKIRLGTGNDFEIYHNGSNSYIDETGTGSLYVRASDSVYITKADGSSNMAQFTAGGGSFLYFNNNLKLNTSSDGISVTGGVTATGSSVFTGASFSDNVTIADTKYAIWGDGSDFKIHHNGSATYIQNYTGDLFIQQNTDDGDIKFQTDDGSGGITEYFRLDGGDEQVKFFKDSEHQDNVKARFGDAGDLEIYHDGSNSHIDDTGTGNLVLRGNGAVSIQKYTGENLGMFNADGGVDLYHDDTKKFETTATGVTITGALTTTGNISSGGHVYVTDTNKFIAGSGEDLQIYHDGSNSYIKDAGTGDLIIESTNLKLRVNGTENSILCDANAGVTLYYDSNARISATNAGATITGTITADGLTMGDNEKAIFGTGGDLEVYHSGSTSYISDIGTGDLKVLFSNDFIIEGANGETCAVFTEDASVELYENNVKKLETKSDGVDVYGSLDASGTGNIDVSSTSSDNWASMTIQGSDASSVYLFLKDTSGERARIQSTANNDIKFLTNGGGDLALELDSSTNASFSNNVTIAGDLTVNGTTTTINTSTIAVEDSMIEMAKDNAANSLDIGTYGKYNDGSARYLGLFADASDDNRFKLFKGTTTQPTTTVDTGATGYEYADILLSSLESRGNIKITSASSPHLEITDSTATCTFKAYAQDSNAHIGTMTNHSFVIDTNGTAAITLDTSQNASFAGNINLVDSKYVYFGASNDFYIGHTSTETNLINSTGSLNIEQHTADGNMVFKADDGSGSGVATYFTLDGGSAATNEYYTKWADNSRIAIGTGKDLQIYHDGSNSYISDKGTGNLYITADNQLRLDCATTGEKFARFYKDGKAELFYDNVSTFETTSTGVTITGALSITGDGSNAATLTESGDGALELDVVDTFTIDAGDQVNIDSGNSEIHLKGSGTTFGKFYKSGDNFYINSPQNDKDIIFTGIDDSAAITALTLDMSNGGSATFRDDIDFGGKLTQTGTGTNTFAGDVDFDGSLTLTGASKNIILDNLNEVRSKDTGGTARTIMRVTDGDLLQYGWSGAGAVQFMGGGSYTARMVIDTSGRVLVGSTSHSISSAQKFEVNCNSGGIAAIIGDSDTIAPFYVKNSGSTTNNLNPHILFQDDSGNRALMGIDYSQTHLFMNGHSGIDFYTNMSTPVKKLEISPTAGITVNGDSSINRGDQNSGELLLGGTSNGGFLDFDSTNLQLNTQRDPNTGTWINTGKSHAHIGLQGADGGSQIIFGTAGANNTTATTRMTINSAGNLGLGTTNPSSDAIVRVLEIDDSVSAGIALDAVATYSIYSSSSSTLVFRDETNAATRMVLNADGDLGINALSPDAKLRIDASDDDQLKLNRTGVGAMKMFVNSSGSFVLEDDGSEAMSIDSAHEMRLNYFVAKKGYSYISDESSTGSARLFLKADATGNAIMNWVSFLDSGNVERGYVGFGSSGNSNIYLYNSLGDTYIYAGAQSALRCDSGASATATAVHVYGTLSKNAGSFRIKHPHPSKKNTHDLVHSFIEGSQADLIYRGKVNLINGKATVNIDNEAGMTDGTFVLLNTNVQCFTSNESDWDAVKGKVEGNVLTIECQNSSSTATISWMVIGERCDEAIKETTLTDDEGKVIVEPKQQEESEYNHIENI